VNKSILSAAVLAVGLVGWSIAPVHAQFMPHVIQSAVQATVAASGASPGGASPNQAAYLAANCANCHGTVGNAVGGMPGLAGLKRDYIIAQMKAFKEGTRPATIMHQLAKGYTDEQIAVMADYFSRQKAN
jgi:cytochrome subunit of sulfide dehydrogenase